MNTLKSFKLSRLFDKSAWVYFGWSYAVIILVLLVIYTMGYVMNEEVPQAAGLLGYLLAFAWILCEICCAGDYAVLQGEKFGQQIKVYVYKMSDNHRKIYVQMNHGSVHEWDCLGYKIIKEHGKARRLILWSEEEAHLYDPDCIGNFASGIYLGKRLCVGVYLKEKSISRAIILVGDNDIEHLNCDSFYMGKKVCVLNAGKETQATVVVQDKNVYRAYSLRYSDDQKSVNVCLENREIIIHDDKTLRVLLPKKDGTYVEGTSCPTILSKAGKVAFHYDEETRESVVHAYDSKEQALREVFRGDIDAIDFDRSEILCGDGQTFKA